MKVSEILVILLNLVGLNNKNDDYPYEKAIRSSLCSFFTVILSLSTYLANKDHQARMLFVAVLFSGQQYPHGSNIKRKDILQGFL
jgi:hypothetical protein